MSELVDLRFTIRLSGSELSALKALASDHDRTVGWEIRRAIKAYLRGEGMTTADNVRQGRPRLLDSA